MRSSFVMALLLSAALAVGGCEQRQMLVTQTQSPAVSGVAAPATRVVVLSPCSPPRLADRTHAPGAPEVHVRANYPIRARQEGVSGCAGFEFHISPEGKAIDLRQLTEFPLGYGFGEATRTALLADRFSPDKAGPLWYYWSTKFIHH